MILYPDQSCAHQPDNDTVCFAAPIDRIDWERLHEMGRKNEVKQTGMRYVIFENESDFYWHGRSPVSVYFMRNSTEVNDRACILLRNNEDADTCLESAAWIRINEDYPGMIYIARSLTDADKWQHLNATIGAPQEYVCMIDYDVLIGEDDE